MADIASQTEFNSNIATLQRIDEDLRGCRNAAANNDLVLWLKFLQASASEVLPKIKRPRTGCDDTCQHCKIINSLNKLKISIIRVSQMDRPTISNSKLFSRVYDDCWKLELELRFAMDKHGMLMTNKDYAKIALQG